ncbi:hypothetical protein NMY22_g2645 [Coprinellus aureogranulatus]|nr:hypothetical protein NMY22_g2645 [Coprinellus aureogranulatus]
MLDFTPAGAEHFLSFSEAFITSHSWLNLESLSAITLSQGALGKIALLPRLAELELVNQGVLSLRYNKPQRPKYPHSHAFQSLRKLFLGNVATISTVVAILQHLSPKSQVQYLTANVDGANPTPLEEVEAIFTAIKNHCNPSTLKDVCLSLDSSLGSREGLDVDVDGEVDISPLFSFQRLTSLYIFSLHRLRFGPSEICEIVASMPGLESLTISAYGCSTETTIPPSLTFQHVAQLARGMPGLHYLRLRFDATQIRGHEIAEGAPFNNLQCLDVDLSPVLSPSRVSRWIRANFPRLDTVEHCYSVGEQSESIHAARWEAVQEEIWAM